MSAGQLPTDARHTPMARRRRAALQGLVLVMCAGVAGFVAAQLITSPADRAAATAPPPPPVLTAPVEHRALSTTVVAPGTVRSAGLVEATPTEAHDAEVLTLTRRVADVGEEVRPGQVLVEVSGRPLIVLPGELPAYRSLRRGSRGQDVRQLQAALRSLGHATAPDASGELGAATARALRRLYAAAGYEPALEGRAVVLPVSEVLYVPAFPARVDAVEGEVGAELQMPTVRVSHGELKVTARVRPADAEQLRRGLRVVLTGDADGRERRGKVGRIGRVVSNDDGTWVPVEIIARKALPSRWNDSSVSARIDVPVTTKKVLAVPVSAVSTSADGTTRVTVLDGTERVVLPVETGASAAGFVEITAVDDRLVPGADVVVGDA